MKRTIAVVLAVLMVLSLTACGENTPSTTNVPGDTTAPQTTEAPKPATKTTYSIGSSGATGAQYIISAAMAAEINKYSERITIDVQATKGAPESVQLLENGDKQVRARSMEAKATQPEAQLFVSCDADADTKAIEAQLKAVGAKPQGTIGRYIMVSTPVSVVNKIADIEGVTYISKGPSVAADLWPLLRSWEAASVCPSAVPPVCMPYR